MGGRYIGGAGDVNDSRFGSVIPFRTHLQPDSGPAEARIPAGPPRSARSRLMSWAAVGFVFSLALGVRLVRVSEPPLDFNPTPQYHSALLARRIYFVSVPGVPEC